MEEVELNEKAIENLAAANRMLHPEQAAADQVAEPVDVAELLYPSMGKAKRQAVKPHAEGATGLSNEEAGAVLYPDRSGGGKYPMSAEDGHIQDAIRDISGRIIVQASYQGDVTSMASAHAGELGFGDLSDLALAGKSLDHGSIHDARLPADCGELSARWANAQRLDARGCSLVKASFAFSDVRGMQVDGSTDISQCDFTGARIDEATLVALKGCKGSESARGLVLNAWDGVDKKKHG